MSGLVRPLSVDFGVRPWLMLALRELGTEEVRGGAASPRILDFWSAVDGLEVDSDEVPWCAAFAAWCVDLAGFRSPRSARALSWRGFGLTLTEPRVGSVVVFDHGGGRGHVGFLLGHYGDTCALLGGNQDDAVRVSLYKTRRVVGYQWPLPFDGCEVCDDAAH